MAPKDFIRLAVAAGISKAMEEQVKKYGEDATPKTAEEAKSRVLEMADCVVDALSFVAEKMQLAHEECPSVLAPKERPIKPISG